MHIVKSMQEFAQQASGSTESVKSVRKIELEAPYVAEALIECSYMKK